MPLITLKNITLNYDITGNLESDKPPLVFIHGLGSSRQDWEFQIPFFNNDYKIITFDLRGHGQSDKPDIPYTIPMFTQDTIQFLEALAYPTYHIVGLSLGGMVAFQLVLDRPQLVHTLTIVNSGPGVTVPSLKVFINFYLRKFSVKLFGMKRLSVSLAHMLLPYPAQAELRNTFIERWNENDPQAYLNSLEAFHNWNVTSRLPEIRCPTQIITADQDYTPVSYKEFYCKFIPHVILVVIINSRHLTPIDQPVAFNQALENFLSGTKHATTK